MKILYFTFITPSVKFGGGIGILQSLQSLCSFADVEYVGPEFEEHELQEYGICLTAVHIVSPNRNKTTRIFNLMFRGISTSFYSSWKNIVSSIDVSKYDCCYLEFTRQDFVVKWAEENDLPIIVRAHNVEADYFEALYNSQKTLFNFIHKRIARKAEKKCIVGADKVLALTPNDRKRLNELYNNAGNIELIPVCVKHFSNGASAKLHEPFFAITGSLWFGPNSDGTIWFLDRVWRNIDEKFYDKYSLVIAGSRPNNRIQELARELKNVYLYDSPDSIDVFYKQATFYIAPIFYGAGMKVKIAEALSCGLPVITTSHAISGYEKMAEQIRVCNDEQEFITQIEVLANKTEEEILQLREEILQKFEQNYSLGESCRLMERHVRETLMR